MKDVYLRRKRRAERASTLLQADELPNPVSPIRCTSLLAHSEIVKRFSYYGDSDLIAAACSDGNVRVYSVSTHTCPLHVIPGHVGAVEDITWFDDDVFGSIGADGQLITWSALRGKCFESLQLCSHAMISLAELDGTIFAGSVCGDLYFVEHSGGRQLTRVSRKHEAHSREIFQIIVDANVLLTVGEDWSVGVWDVASRTRRAHLVHCEPVNCAAATKECIAIVCSRGLHIYRNGADFALLSVVCGLHGPYSLFSAEFATPDVIMTAGGDGLLAFLSVDKQGTNVVLARVRTPCRATWAAGILDKHHVVVMEVCDHGNFDLELPHSVTSAIMLQRRVEDRRKRAFRGYGFAVSTLATALFAFVVTARRR